MKNFFLTLLALLSTVFFAACNKDRSSDPTPTPEPTKTDAAIRFYTTKGAAAYSSIKFYGKYNGASDYVELTDVKTAEYVEKYDIAHKDALLLGLSKDELVIYQAKLKLDKGTHQFKMNFTYNGASYKEEQEIDVYVGIGGVLNSTTVINSVSYLNGGLKVANIQSFLDKYVNDKKIASIKVE